MQDEILNLFNKHGANNPDKVSAPDPESILGKIMNEIQSKQGAPESPLKPKREDIEQAFSEKYGSPEEFAKQGIEDVSEEVYVHLSKALNQKLREMGIQQNGMILSYSVLRLLTDVYKDVITNETRGHSKISQMIGLNSTRKSMFMVDEMKSENPLEAMENILASLAFAAVELIHLTVEGEGQRLYKEKQDGK